MQDVSGRAVDHAARAEEIALRKFTNGAAVTRTDSHTSDANQPPVDADATVEPQRKTRASLQRAFIAASAKGSVGKKT